MTNKSIDTELTERILKTCSKCNKTGYSIIDGKRVTCDCLWRFRTAQTLILDCNFPFNHLTVPRYLAFDGVKNKRQKLLVEGVREDIQHATNLGLSFFFYGENGIGKTTSAVVLAWDILFYYRAVKYTPNFTCWFEPSFSLMSKFFDDKAEFNEIINKNVLVIDDFGKESFRANSKNDNAKTIYNSVFEQVFRNRSNKNLVTIVTSNKNPVVIHNELSPSISSLLGMQEREDNLIFSGRYGFVLFEGTDKRPEFEGNMYWDKIYKKKGLESEDLVHQGKTRVRKKNNNTTEDDTGRTDPDSGIGTGAEEVSS